MRATERPESQTRQISLRQLNTNKPADAGATPQKRTHQPRRRRLRISSPQKQKTGTTIPPIARSNSAPLLPHPLSQDPTTLAKHSRTARDAGRIQKIPRTSWLPHDLKTAQAFSRKPVHGELNFTANTIWEHTSDIALTNRLIMPNSRTLDSTPSRKMRPLQRARDSQT